MATKLKVILQRVESKDYIDVAAMIRNGVGLDSGLAGSLALYRPNFQPSECLKALVYFNGGDLDLLQEVDKFTLTSAVANVRELPDVDIVSKNLN
jgi:hypothetical protein